MPTYEARCPDCGHVTEARCSIEAWRLMPTIVCECGAVKATVIHAPTLAGDRKTEGKR